MRIWHPRNPAQALAASVVLVTGVAIAMAVGTLLGGPLLGAASALPLAALIPVIIR